SNDETDYVASQYQHEIHTSCPLLSNVHGNHQPQSRHSDKQYLLVFVYPDQNASAQAVVHAENQSESLVQSHELQHPFGLKHALQLVDSPSYLMSFPTHFERSVHSADAETH